MLNTLLQLAVNKSFDAAQCQLWACEFLGIMPAIGMLYRKLYHSLNLSDEYIEPIMHCMTASCLSELTEKQREVALCIVRLADPMRADDGSFERAVLEFFKAAGQPYPPQGSRREESLSN